MGEGEQKLCLVEHPLELQEETPLQVQMQMLEEMQDMEALEAAAEMEALVAMVIIIKLLANQEQKGVSVELEVMGVAAEEEEVEG